jgi:hypothetical protein
VPPRAAVAKIRALVMHSASYLEDLLEQKI